MSDNPVTDSNGERAGHNVPLNATTQRAPAGNGTERHGEPAMSPNQSANYRFSPEAWSVKTKGEPVKGDDWSQWVIDSQDGVPRGVHAEGCIVLGKKGKPADCYTTRYKIDHRMQRQDLTQDIFQETFAPCCVEENRSSVGRFLWTILASESFLFSLHMLALALGVSKEALDYRTVDAELEIIHSSIETFATCLQIILRTVALVVEYKKIKTHIVVLEDVKSTSAVRGSALRRAIIANSILGAVLVLTSVSCAIAFNYLAHLGWTILSNNFVLIVAMLCGGLVAERMDKVVALIREDQHKAVLYESVLLLKEARVAFKTKAPWNYFYRVDKFITSLKETEMFHHPDHIKADHSITHDQSLLLTMQMQGESML